ncbi:hypothetical protein GCM10022222_30080 [Amycolatopsis ultiminotia]|uniref:Uncharacterized protein n=1 Tax=Amycolatopsis ultiminotia TaxID=543629 RepID=A0ABP6W649_9PSEU
MLQIGHQPQVLRAGEQIADGRELSGHADCGTHLVRLAHRVVAGHPHLTAIRREQGGQDPDRGGLARADRAGCDPQVNAVEHDVVAVRFAQPADADRWNGGAGGHVVPLSR